MTDSPCDAWSQWLFHRRFGGDARRLPRVLASLALIRDKAWTYAKRGDGEVLLAVRCGDGLIAFGALAQVKTCSVIFSNISQDLLDHA